jgi:hypothetical protein
VKSSSGFSLERCCSCEPRFTRGIVCELVGSALIAVSEGGGNIGLQMRRWLMTHGIGSALASFVQAALQPEN